MKHIRKLAIEAENLARERGHDPRTTFTAASFNKTRRFAVVVCNTCSAEAILRSNPPAGVRDIEGSLTKTNCNVATIANVHHKFKLGQTTLSTARACANLIP